MCYLNENAPLLGVTAFKSGLVVYDRLFFNRKSKIVNPYVLYEGASSFPRGDSY